MSRGKYRFNQETLSYERIKLGWKKFSLKALAQLSTSIVLAVGLVFLFMHLWDTPKEKNLKRELVEISSNYEFVNKRMDIMEKILNDLRERDDNIYRSMLGSEPLSDDIRQAGFGGSNQYKELEGYSNSDLMIETSRKLEILYKKMYVQSTSYDGLIVEIKSQENRLFSIPAIQPIALDNHARIASHFGFRKHPIYNIMKMHEGIDFSCAHGTPVFATGNATVKRAGRMSGYGLIVVLDHGYGYTTRYAHLSRILVKEGQKINRGETIGKVGSTGLSVAPHLHYEVRKEGHALNPANFFFNDLTPEEYNLMIEQSAQGGGISLD